MAFGGRGEGGRGGGGVMMPTCSFDSTLSHASPESLYGLLCKCSSQNLDCHRNAMPTMVFQGVHGWKGLFVSLCNVCPKT